MTYADLESLFRREPFSGVPPLARLTDRQILILLAPRDEDGVLIPERDRADNESPARLQRERRIARAGRELPPAEALGIPEEVRRSDVYQRSPGYVRMFWAVWRQRGLAADATLEHWRATCGRR